jgi:hypothetical protein
LRHRSHGGSFQGLSPTSAEYDTRAG